MAPALPLYLPIYLISQFELVSRNEPHVILIWEYEVCHLFLVYAPVPTDLDVGLSLGFFELLVVVCLQSDQRLKNFFVLFRVLVAEKDWLLKFFKHNMVKVIECGMNVCLP